MPMRPIKKGSTDQSCVIFIFNATTGLPETGVDYNTAGIDLWYRREGETKTSLTEASLAALNSAHSDGGIEPISNGEYRLDLPDAACATGANGVQIGGTVTGMVVIGPYIPLVDYDPYDAVRQGMTSLPNANANAAGGLPISAAGGLALDTKLANTNEITAARMGALTDWINGGRLDLILDIIAADVVNLDGAAMRGTDSAGLASELAKVPKSDGNVTFNATALASINAEVDTALNTAIPGGPTADSINERIVAIDAYGAPPSAATIKTAIEAAGSHLALILEDTGTTIPGTLTTIDGIVDDILTDTGTTLPGTLATIAGYIDAEVAAILEDTGTTLPNLLGAPAGASMSADIAAVKAQTAAIEADTQDLQTQVGTDGAGLTNLPWNAAWDTEVQSECTDALNAYDPPTKAEMDSALGALETHGDGAWATAIGFSTHSAADVWAATNATLGIAYSLMFSRIYRFFFNKMNITDADGSVDLYDEAGTGVIGTLSITDDATDTLRTAVAWA